MHGPSLAEPSTSPEVGEICAACGRVIGSLEQPYVWDQNIVCFGCHRDFSQSSPAAGSDAPAAPSNFERVFHADRQSQISRSRIVLGGVTYALSEVRSVRLHKLAPRRIYPLFISLGGLALALVGLNRHLDRLDAMMLVAGSTVLVAGAIVAIGLRSKYTILLLVNDREVPAFNCSKGKYARTLLDAIGEAIVERGQFIVPPPPKPHADRRAGLEV
jgi:hypothetical protein